MISSRRGRIGKVVLAALALVLTTCSEPAGSSARGPGLKRIVVTATGTAPAPDASEPDAAAADASADGTHYEVPTPPPGAGKLEDPTGLALTDFFAALRLAQEHRKDGRVAIVQFGDSHTQADFVTGHMRQKLQERFGDAGRGFLLAGKPIHHYYQGDASYGQSGDWFVSYGLHMHTDVEPFGLAGVRVRGSSKKQTSFVGTCTSCPSGHRVARFEIFYMPTVNGGTLGYKVDDGPWKKFSTRMKSGDTHLGGYFDVKVSDGEHTLTLRPGGDGPVDVFGIALERDQPGVLVDALGVVGAQAAHLYKWDWTLVGEQLAHRDPRLVVLQYGTNETDDPDLDLQRFEDRLVELVGRIKAAAPGASILILGPPDRGVRERKDCDPPGMHKKKGKGHNQKGHRKDHKPGHEESRKGKKKPRTPIAKAPYDPNAPIPPGCEWKTPEILLAVIAAERRAAMRTGVAFFDAYTAMGGADRMDGWYHQDPPFAYHDHVHFTGRGGASLADLLLAELLSRFEAWLKTAPPLPA